MDKDLDDGVVDLMERLHPVLTKWGNEKKFGHARVKRLKEVLERLVRAGRPAEGVDAKGDPPVCELQLDESYAGHWAAPRGRNKAQRQAVDQMIAEYAPRGWVERTEHTEAKSVFEFAFPILSLIHI